MKKLLRSLATAFTMFSRVPMPRVDWKPENMRDTLVCFPLVGVPLGLVLAGWVALTRWLSFGQVLFAAGITLLPVLYTGGIHLDGFCDTVDALASHAAPERKREILKDSHVGAFAVIGVSAYLLAYFALGSELFFSSRTLYLLFLIPVLSRAVAGYAAVSAESGGAGLLAAMRGAAENRPARPALGVWFVLCAAAMLIVSPLAGLAVSAAAALTGYSVYRMAKRQFGGMSGDIAGYLVQVSEIVMLCALVLIQRVNWL